MGIITVLLDRVLNPVDHADVVARRILAEVNVRVVKARKILVVSGAGISCSSGIPDFRSEDGLYSLVKARYPTAFVKGKDLFSASLFNSPETTSLFYTFIAELSFLCAKARPTRTHQFIARLENKKKLLRSYTQNIDGLERRMGLESGGRGKGWKKVGTRNVELHGDIERVRCVLCEKDFEARVEWVELFREGGSPDCPACEGRNASRVSRSARAISIGTLRPAIVLYEENHPFADEIGGITAYDMAKNPELLLIMGTSMKVHGFKALVKDFAKAVHAKGGIVVYVNATPPAREWEGVIDYHIMGETDVWVEKCEEEWRRVKPSDWEVQTVLDGTVIPGVKPVRVRGKGKAKACHISGSSTPYQLPTPRPSTSPPRPQGWTSSDLPPFSGGRISRRGSSSDASSVLSSAPSSPPLSPSKRRAYTAPPTPELELGLEIRTSPIKKAKSMYPEAPLTGLPPTPGKGNLFTELPSPAKSTLFADIKPKKEEWVDVEEQGVIEVFGSPKKRLPTKPRAGKPGRTAGGKENAPASERKVRRSIGAVRGGVRGKPPRLGA